MKLALAALVLALAAARPARAADAADGDKAAEPAPPPMPEGGDPCIDEDVKADLFAKRRQRTSRDRLFQQTNRHELSLRGGYYVSDASTASSASGDCRTSARTSDTRASSTVVRLSHDRRSGGRGHGRALTRLMSAGGPELERTFAVLQGERRAAQLMFDADLVWALAHAKIRLGGSITHFDLYLDGGGRRRRFGDLQDIAGNGGLGLKFFLGRAWAFRVDVRDYVFRQQLLAETLLVNDSRSTSGFSIYLPMRE